MKEIFESKYYPSIMFFLISATLLLIAFNFMNIVNSVGDDKPNENIILTGNAVSEPTEEINVSYPIKNYIFYYLFLNFLIIMIAIIASRLIIYNE